MGFLQFLRQNAPFLSAGFLLSFTSSYGQTFFISLFAGEIMRDFDLSHGQWGLIYTIATTVSALAMVWAGVLTDRFRVRYLMVVVSILLALSCIAMAGAQGAVVLGVVIFALRLNGQGMMSHLSIVAMARWFNATRGKAISISSMGFAMGQAVLPLAFVALLAWVDWRLLWLLAAAIVLATAPIIFRLLREERTPQSVAESSAALGMGGRHWTRGEMVKNWLFWGVLPLMIGPPAFGTALFFHQVHLTEVKGWELAGFVSLLPLFTAVSVLTTFTSGGLIDRIGTRRLMQVIFVPFVLAFFVLGQAQTLWGAALGMMIFGICTGAQSTIPSAFWAEHYGTRHIGSIKALVTAILVFGSAIGPGLTGLLIDLGIDFPDQMTGISIYFALTGILAAVTVEKAARFFASPAQVDVVGT
ncbi:MFS transporter [Sulfitobacter sp. D35]|uniref:MFS transporter n=1 Tax=Sulfitobacter sp. D35 TaxID=3083252 RepID=UPI00296E88C8|nr:MFS transporter [Sulfitobacter sp. D35]MDW4498085.1 MFS transporter [Sulfitobacter sp. D35]